MNANKPTFKNCSVTSVNVIVIMKPNKTKTKKINNSSFFLPPRRQYVLHCSPSRHLGVAGAGGLPSPSTVDPRLSDPGEQHSWSAWREHLPAGGVGVSVLAAGCQSCGCAAVWQAGCSEMRAGQQTSQRRARSGESWCAGKDFGSEGKLVRLSIF